MKTIVVALVGLVWLHAPDAPAQSIAAEAAQTAGYSSDGIAVAATQVRVFGEVVPSVRFHLEGAWAARSRDLGDAFGGAYPYDNHVQLMDVYGERVFRPGAGLVAVRVGRFRTPFGISAASDHAYSGFLRAPLIRYDDYFALSNTFFEHGANVAVGVPRLYVETTVGAPSDAGEAHRRPGTDRAVRVQGAAGPWIIGVSHIRTQPYQPARFAHGDAEFAGIDLRWMRGGIQVRGEWITGQPFRGTHTAGGYADLLVHRPGLGPVTVVVRAERLAYDAVPPFALYAERYTAGARIRLRERVAAQVNVLAQHGVPREPRAALDVALTYVFRRD